MLYITNKELPKILREGTGESLCKLWFLCLYGGEANTETYDNFEELCEGRLEIEEISPYKVPFPSGEILVIDGTYFVGDGFGNPIYSPTRKEYYHGKPIERKYSVKKKS